MATVEILLATFNSEQYVSSQLDSLLAQDFRDISVTVRDDGSSDRTWDILNEYAQKDARIKLLPDRTSSGSAKSNFFRLLLASSADYVMTCDADDFWLPQKVSHTLAAMQKLENGDRDVPCLVHCDLKVAGEDLGIIAESLVEYEKLTPSRTGLKQLTAQNNVTGCAMMVNRALLNYIKREPDAVMHDWWCALIASAFGRIAFLPESLILYRQHGSNQVGAYNASSADASLSRLTSKERNRTIYDSMFRQASSFAEEYSDKLTPEQKKILTGYGEMLGMSHFGKCVRLVTGGYWKNTFIRNVGQFLVI